jgi:hypothetical protein
MPCRAPERRLKDFNRGHQSNGRRRQRKLPGHFTQPIGRLLKKLDAEVVGWKWMGWLLRTRRSGRGGRSLSYRLQRLDQLGAFLVVLEHLERLLSLGRRQRNSGGAWPRRRRDGLIFLRSPRLRPASNCQN